MRSALYAGTLVHARREPRPNTFRYPVAYFLLDLDELPELERRLRLFSVNRRERRLVPRPRLHRRRRHAAQGGGRPLLRRARPRGRAGAHADAAPRARLRLQPGHVPLVLRPRRRTGVHRRGARKHLRRAPAASCWTAASRRYEHAQAAPRLALLRARPELRVRVLRARATRSGRASTCARTSRRPLTAVLHGRRAPLTNRSLARFLVRYPLMPVQVIGLIHWQALKLYREARAVPPQAALRPGVGLGAASELHRRRARRAARRVAPSLARVALPLVERALPRARGRHARGAAAGRRRHAASAPAATVRLDVLDDRLFSRVATRGAIGPRRGVPGGRVALGRPRRASSSSCSANAASRRASATRASRGSSRRGRARTAARASSPRAATSPRTTTSATTSSS